MKICLIRPPAFSKNLNFPSGPRFGIPLNLLYLAGPLEQDGHEVTVYDALTDFDINNISKDENGAFHIGASWKQISDYVKDNNPDLVGIANPFSDFFWYTIQCAKVVKATLPSVPVVAGGPHATSDPASFLFDNSPVDFVLRAECEHAFPIFVKTLESKKNLSSVPNLAYIRDKEIIINPNGSFISDLDSLPLPAYHLIDMEKSFDFVRAGYPSRFSFSYSGSHREISIITSRGCPYNCIFCGNHLHMGKKWRYHSVPYIINHLQILIQKFGINHFHIEDDNLGQNTTRFEEFLDSLLSKKWNITWDTPNGIRADRLNPSLIRKAKESGCTYLIFGIESGNQEVLNQVIHKNLNLDKVIEAAKAAKKAKLDIHAFYVVGFPGETEKQIEETFTFALHLLSKYDVLPHLCLARPLPGTPLYEICRDNDFLTEPVLPEIGKGLRGELYPRQMIKTEHFSPKELEAWVNRFNRRMILLILMKSLLFLAVHPTAMIKVTKFLLTRPFGKDTLLRLFYSGLFFKFNFLNRTLKV